MSNTKTKIIHYGFAKAKGGNEVYIYTQTDEKIVVQIKDKDLIWDVYSKHVRITIEVISNDEMPEGLWKEPKR